jgi:hypothetical protein
MPTDYILFNHGVNTRDTRPKPDYADGLFALIQKHYHQVPGRTIATGTAMKLRKRLPRQLNRVCSPLPIKLHSSLY